MEKLKQLQESLTIYRQLIDKYVKHCQLLRQRRRGAIDSVMVEIDTTIAVNERMIRQLEKSIESTEAEIRRIQSSN